MATKRKLTSKSSEARRSLGRATDQAAFPASSPIVEMPPDYASLLRDIKQRIQQGRLQTVLAANSAMVLLYWDISRAPSSNGKVRKDGAPKSLTDSRPICA